MEKSIVVSITLEIDEAQEIVDALAQRAELINNFKDRILNDVSAQIISAKKALHEADIEDKKILSKMNEEKNGE